MSEPIGFFYDPRCPWAWRTSKWVRELEREDIVSVDWRFFSLGIVNEGSEDVLDDPKDVGATALRTLAFVKNAHGNQRSGELYAAMGNQSHEVPRRLTNRLVRAALKDAGWDAKLVEEAMSDEETKQTVLRDHHLAADEVGAFGVPTVMLESGRAIFGPVVTDEGTTQALELWDHVRWLIDNAGFFELKRERS